MLLCQGRCGPVVSPSCSLWARVVFFLYYFLVQCAPVLFYLVASSFLRPSPVLSCPVLFCSVRSRPTLSGPWFSPVRQRFVLFQSERSGPPRLCFVLLYPVLLFRSLLTCPFRSGPILSCSVLSGPVLLRSFLPGSVRSSPVWSCPGLSCRALFGPVPCCPLLFCSVQSVSPRPVRLFGSVLSCLALSRPICPVLSCLVRICPTGSVLSGCGPVLSIPAQFVFFVLFGFARSGPVPF